VQVPDNFVVKAPDMPKPPAGLPGGEMPAAPPAGDPHGAQPPRPQQ
jgi:hypothetical protein